ncbi:phosphoenolpyruvate synthase [Clostridium tagluense]|uniref:phosphoenolpyruvate synthase n=1 Tax=Clostridium tagluense TaxID=360422 RepID=UPI001CF4F72F|nr:phosphoenolpyruvate synthase [Clostridium tagluense]MCB2326554.1 phosphoenolpyruvate synthase [Clostridium tagluense]MCB2331277.1 phosphoenolpyruvate synthase [Clostridium tagluense]MCB2364965.1 phosphoenolpyruvate synthase [Clostridium tagluense]
MSSYLLSFKDIDKSKLEVVGGKGANLGELSRIEGLQVPEGFCVTTMAYKKVIEYNKEFNRLLEELSHLKVDDRKKIGVICGKIRSLIEGITIPKDIDEGITAFIKKFGEKNAYAVRSSATAEDLPLASFAGQQDTYLNIIGKDDILHHVSKCWASLFTDRAVIYRIQNNFDHRRVYLSVVIQKMVFPVASGIMFTADPISGNRKVTSIDASFGLGEALVSGLVNADIYKAKAGKIIDKKISTKKVAIYGIPKGGTEQREIDADQQNDQTLTDQQILQLEQIGRKIEVYFGRPQDIEWCLYENKIYIVQSRPITTLYPAPIVADDKTHVFFSFGHRQMMTEAMSPLSMTFFAVLFKMMVDTPMYYAGGRIYVDSSNELRSPIMRKSFVKGLKSVDVLMQNAFYNVLKRDDIMKNLYKSKKAMVPVKLISYWLIKTIEYYRKNDPSIPEYFMSRSRAMMSDLEQQSQKISGNELFDFVEKSMARIKDNMMDTYGVVFSGAYATSWINKKLEKWLGEKNLADTLAQSVSNNVTSEMGLELLDVSDVIRKYPEVIKYLEHPKDETFFEDLVKLPGGIEARDAIREFLKKYGMRCSAEIDISRTRWNERPTILVPLILGNIKVYPTNAHETKFEQGLREAKEKEQDILSRLQKLSGGRAKAKKAKRAISVLRNYAGYREFNKYALIWYEWVIKQVIMKEAERLVLQGLIKEPGDIFYLEYEELREVIKANKLDYSIIQKRKEDYEIYEKLTPPRVITSDGEIISSQYDISKIPEGALAGVPVSAGIIEGRARIILRIEDANIEEGDILVTTFTDPSWTPVFVSIKGLVTEVGGMMTHGAVVAREYGLPAVVSVENATKLIKDGQRIRVNGTEGYVEILH